MNYTEFKEILNPNNDFYNIVPIDKRTHGLRGCNRENAEAFIKLVGEDKVKIYRY